MRSGWIVIAGVVGVGVLVWVVCFGTTPTAPAALGKKWHEQVYSLDEGEVVRFVPPPYPPSRAIELSHSPEMQLGLEVYENKGHYVIYRHNYTPLRMPKNRWSDTRLSFDRGLFNWGDWRPPRPVGNLQAAIEFCELGHWPDPIIPPELQNLPVDGDWLIRAGADLDQRMKALQSILSSVTKRDLVIEFRPVRREVDDWSLRLEEHGPFTLKKNWRWEPGVVLVDRKLEAQKQRGPGGTRKSLPLTIFFENDQDASTQTGGER